MRTELIRGRASAQPTAFRLDGGPEDSARFERSCLDHLHRNVELDAGGNVIVMGLRTSAKDTLVEPEEWGRRYPHAGYGGWCRDWLFGDDPAPDRSYGNGSARRVAAVGWAFDVTCQGTVSAAAGAFLHSSGVEDAIRNAVSFGGDADSLACIAGAIVEAHYGGLPAAIQTEVFRRLDDPLREEVAAFARAYGVPLAANPCPPGME